MGAGAQAPGGPCPSTGPLGEGLRPGLGGGTPPASPSCSPRRPGFYGTANPTRGVLETWWANPGPNPSNRLHLWLRGGRAGCWQAWGPSCAGPCCDSSPGSRRPSTPRTEGWLSWASFWVHSGLPSVSLAVLALRLSGSEEISRSRRPRACRQWGPCWEPAKGLWPLGRAQAPWQAHPGPGLWAGWVPEARTKDSPGALAQEAHHTRAYGHACV